MTMFLDDEKVGSSPKARESRALFLIASTYGFVAGVQVMPGVTIVEAMAQTAAVVVGVSLDLADRGMRTYFMAIDKVKFRRMVVPGDVLELHVTVKRGGGKIWKFEGQGIVDGEIACEAEFTAMMDQPAREAADG